MKIKYILGLAAGLISSASALVTPSGLEIPSELLIYLNCPIGDVICKNGKGSTCAMRSGICNYGNPAILGELLSDNGYDIGDRDPQEFCKIHLEVCDMIFEYDPPLTDNYIYNYERYYTCNLDDTICQYGKISSCETVVKKCNESDDYSDEDCQKLSAVCSAIETGEIPVFTTTSTEAPVTTTIDDTTTTTSAQSTPTNPVTPSGLEIPNELLTFLNCPIGDVLCKNGKGSSCAMRSSVCKNGNPAILGELLSDNGYDIGDRDPQEFCKIHLEVCDMIFEYDPPLTDDYIYNYKRYFTCNIDDTMCQYGMVASCETVVKKCKESEEYPDSDCDKLSVVCSAIESGEIPSFEATTTTTTTTIATPTFTTVTLTRPVTTSTPTTTTIIIPVTTTTSKPTTTITITKAPTTTKTTKKIIITRTKTVTKTTTITKKITITRIKTKTRQN